MAAAGAAAGAGDEAAGAGKGSPGQVPGAAMVGAAGLEKRCGCSEGCGGLGAVEATAPPLLGARGWLGRSSAPALRPLRVPRAGGGRGSAWRGGHRGHRLPP